MIESIRLALQGIMANRLRSALTMLGILIGVAAVIILIAVGAGSSAAVQNQLAGLGTNTLTIFPTGGFGGPGGAANRTGTVSRPARLTAKDVSALEDKTNAPNIVEVAPVVNANATAAYEGATHEIAQGIGTTPNYFGIRNLEIASGSAFSDDDVSEHRKVVVLGQTVVDDLFGEALTRSERRSRSAASTWTVIGVLESKGTNGFADQDDTAIAPVTAVQDALASRSTRLQPHHRPGEVTGRIGRGVGGDHVDRCSRPTRSRRPTSRCSTRPICSTRAPRRTRCSPCFSARSPRSRCSSAASAS